MRTTITIEPDVERLLRARMEDSKATMKEIVNDALRRGLSGAWPKCTLKRIRVIGRPLGLRPGIDPNKLNQLLDELEVQEYARKLAAPQQKG